MLLENGANIDGLAAFPPDFQQPKSMLTALQSAIRHGKIDCAQLLLDRGASIKGDELLLAALLDQGAIYQEDAFWEALVKDSDTDMSSLMLSLIGKDIDLERMSTTGETALQAT